MFYGSVCPGHYGRNPGKKMILGENVGPGDEQGILRGRTNSKTAGAACMIAWKSMVAGQRRDME